MRLDFGKLKRENKQHLVQQQESRPMTEQEREEFREKMKLNAKQLAENKLK